MPPTSSTAEKNVARTPEAVREGLVGDRTLLWDPTADSGSRLHGLLLPPVRIGGEWIERPNPVRPQIERLGALGRLAQQREREWVTQDELDRVARQQRKVEEDDWMRRLQYLKDQVEAEEQRTRSLHSNN